MELEGAICDLHRMAQLAVMAADDGEDELASFGLRQAEQMTEALRRRFYDLFEKHFGRQSA
jgi:hypothetical protein